MCGIVGYTGQGQAVPFLLAGLNRLEYRGYDSAGVAVMDGGQLSFVKTAGRIAELEEVLAGRGLSGRVGVGHTRWATHGRPNQQNAHPHLGCHGDIAVAHNGIIENHAALRRELEARGHRFRSETDSEVVVHLLEEYSDRDLRQALQAVTARLRGTYALAVVRTQDPNAVGAARQDSPLLIGLGEGENMLASDIPALISHTRRVVVVEDGEVVVLSAEAAHIYNQEGEVERTPLEVGWNLEEAERGGLPHFMIKEIREQPRALRQTMAGRLSEDLSQLQLEIDPGPLPRKLWFVACGTSYHASLVARRLAEDVLAIPAEAELASEFRYRHLALGGEDTVVAVSQSGETLDTLSAMRQAKAMGARVIGVTNVIGSSISREAELNVPTLAGPEIAVASSKAYTTQILALTFLVLAYAKASGRLTAAQEQAWAKELWALPEKAELVLQKEQEIEAVAARLSQAQDVFYVGRGTDYAVAMEGQLKLKEISYLHAEALAAGELKHGTLALIEAGVPVVALLTQGDLIDKTLSNLAEIKARGGWVYAITSHDLLDRQELDHVFVLPAGRDELAPVLAALPLQLLAYYVALLRQTDIDKPRNLAKSVTVE